MIESTIIDDNPLAGTRCILHYDHASDRIIIENLQDADAAAVESAQRQYRATDERARWKRDMVKVAEIPLLVLEQLKQKGCHPDQDQKAFAKWLDDPDNRLFRARPGRIGNIGGMS